MLEVKSSHNSEKNKIHVTASGFKQGKICTTLMLGSLPSWAPEQPQDYDEFSSY